MNKYKLIDNNKGFVAIFATIIIMIILGILIISFSTISNREVSTATNRQLSVQASYTAQSGINDVYSIIRKANGAVINQTDSCTKTGVRGTGPDIYNVYPTLSLTSTTSSKYTCVLVDDVPSTLVYDCSLGGGACPNNSIVTLLENSGSAPISSININWTDSSPESTTCLSYTANLGVFPSYNKWPCMPELLRVDLVPFNSGHTSLSDIQTSAKTFFIYPSTSVLLSGQTCPVPASSPTCTPSFSSLPTSISSANSDYLAQTKCSNISCNYSVDGMSANSSYYIRIQYYYNQDDDNNFINGPDITIKGQTTTGNAVQFNDAAVKVDITGYANGTEERTTTELSLQGSISGSIPTLPLPPNYGIQSMNSLCKSFSLGSPVEEIIPQGAPQGIGTTGPITTEDDSNPCNPI